MTDTTTGETRPGATPDRRVDPLPLAAGVVALAVAVLAVVGGDWLRDVDPRWVLAAAAVTVGVVALLSTLRRRS